MKVDEPVCTTTQVGGGWWDEIASKHLFFHFLELKKKQISVLIMHNAQMSIPSTFTVLNHINTCVTEATELCD